MQKPLRYVTAHITAHTTMKTATTTFNEWPD